MTDTLSYQYKIEVKDTVKHACLINNAIIELKSRLEGHLITKNNNSQHQKINKKPRNQIRRR